MSSTPTIITYEPAPDVSMPSHHIRSFASIGDFLLFSQLSDSDDSQTQRSRVVDPSGTQIIPDTQENC